MFLPLTELTDVVLWFWLLFEHVFSEAGKREPAEATRGGKAYQGCCVSVCVYIYLYFFVYISLWQLECVYPHLIFLPLCESARVIPLKPFRLAVQGWMSTQKQLVEWKGDKNRKTEGSVSVAWPTLSKAPTALKSITECYSTWMESPLLPVFLLPGSELRWWWV